MKQMPFDDNVLRSYYYFYLFQIWVDDVSCDTGLGAKYQP